MMQFTSGSNTHMRDYLYPLMFSILFPCRLNSQMYTRWRLCAQFLIFFAIYGMTRHDSQKNNRNDERVIHLSDAVARRHFFGGRS
jgi:hypothetical protein